MGRIVRVSSATNLEKAGLLKPVIYCFLDNTTISCAVSLNQALAEKLSEVNPKRRTIRLAACFEEIINTQPDNVVIKDFEQSQGGCIYGVHNDDCGR